MIFTSTSVRKTIACMLKLVVIIHRDFLFIQANIDV